MGENICPAMPEFFCGNAAAIYIHPRNVASEGRITGLWGKEFSWVHLIRHQNSALPSSQGVGYCQLWLRRATFSRGEGLIPSPLGRGTSCASNWWVRCSRLSFFFRRGELCSPAGDQRSPLRERGTAFVCSVHYKDGIVLRFALFQRGVSASHKRVRCPLV